MENPITPPSNLVEAWYANADSPDEDVIKGVAIRAARWGADQELEACCGWIESQSDLGVLSFAPNVRAKFRCEVIDRLRTARRPKPSSLKEQALEDFDGLMSELDGAGKYSNCADRIRRALESLPDPQD